MSVKEESESKKYIKDNVRNAIKKMAYMNKIAKCVSLAPKPVDFATQVIGEVNSMMVNIQNFTNKINTILDTYTNFPSDYLTKSVNNVMDTLTDYASRATASAQGAVDTIQNASNNITSAITTTSSSINSILGTNIGNSLDTSIITDTLNDATGVIDTVNGYVTNTNEAVQDKLKEVVDYIKEKLDSVSTSLNSYFSDYMSTEGLSVLDDATTTYSDGTLGGSLISTTSETMNNIIKNFNIGKIATAFAGMGVSIGLVYAGLDKLPALDLENIMAFGKSSLKETKHSWEEELASYTESDEYKRLKALEEETNKKIREEIRKDRKKSRSETSKKLTQEELIELRKNSESLAKKIRTEKRKAKKAKIAEKYKNTIGIELNTFKEQIEHTGTNIKDEWNDMMTQYKNSVLEIKNFFTGDPNEAPGAKYIDECCDKIEQDCKSIEEETKNLIKIVTCVFSKISIPVSIGSAVDNPAFKVTMFFADCKQIANDIRKLIVLGVDIFKQISKLVKIIIEDVNDVAKIEEELMKLLNIQWLIDLIEEISDLFYAKIKDSKELLENTISPILYNETENYEAEVEALENLENGGSGTSIYVYNWNTNSKLDVSDKRSVSVKINSEGTIDTSEDNMDNLEEAYDILDEKGENIVAYKSPLLNDDGTEFTAWIYYHANVDNLYERNSQKRRARRIMKKASKTGKRKSGGKNYLLDKTLRKTSVAISIEGDTTFTPNAFDAFYWYTKWTNDATDDTIDTSADDGTEVVSPVMTTENGTLVELEDGRRVFVNSHGVQSGDYVIVEGKRYRVK